MNKRIGTEYRTSMSLITVSWTADRNRWIKREMKTIIMAICCCNGRNSNTYLYRFILNATRNLFEFFEFKLIDAQRASEQLMMSFSAVFKRSGTSVQS